MANVVRAEIGSINLCKETEDGRIVQIGLTAEQHQMLQAVLSAMSKEQQFIQLPPEYDLVRKSEVKEMK